MTREHRSRDLTPVGNEEGRSWIPTGGGADRFLDFVLDEAIPYVRGAYRTLPYTILAGHSLGGLFGTYAAATRPGAFDAIIAMSPSLQYDGGSVAERYATAIAQAPKPLRLVTSSGAAEPIIDWATSRFASVLDTRTHPNVVYQHHRYPHSHSITPLPSLIDGLLFIFQPISLANAALRRVPDPFHADSSRWVTSFVAADSTYVQGARAFPAPPDNVLVQTVQLWTPWSAATASTESTRTASDDDHVSVTYEPKESVAHTTLARQDSPNAMNRQMYASVNAAFHRFDADEQARVGILKSSRPAEQLSSFIETPGALLKPVVAAIHGHTPA